MAASTDVIRNLLFAGHTGCGKTTLTEMILKASGEIGAVGSVEQGTAVGDFTPEEKEHGHSLVSAITHAHFHAIHVNIIDSPGSPDFVGQAISMLPAVETVAVVINAAAGIEGMTRRVMEYAARHKLCRMIIINKIDAENVDLPGLLQDIQDTFGSICLPVNLPADGATRVVDCFFNPEGTSDLGSVEDAHTAILDQVVEIDEALMAQYLEHGKVEPAALHAAFEKAMRQGHLVPICFTSAHPHQNPDQPVGIEPLLEVFEKLMPNPTEGNPRPFIREGADAPPFLPVPDPDKHVLAHVFQVRIDPFVGKLCAFRVHQGTVTKDTQLFIGDPHHGERRKPVRVAHLFKLQGGKHVEVPRAIPGDIAAVAKIDELHFDCVLHDSHDEDNLRLDPLDFPEPMQGIAITTHKRGDEQKLADALTKLLEEDPTFKVVRDETTHQTVIYGIGDLHVRVILEKIAKRYNVEVDTSPPKVAYRETITGKAEGHHRHRKQTGGAGQFGEVYLRVEPLERGTGFEFANDTFGGSIPQQFLPAVEKGVRMALNEGAIAGFPIQDVKVSVYDGKHHPVDSKEVAFIAAGKRAFLDAFHKAKPTLLEPLVNLEITVAASQMGDVTGDLSGKRGRVQGTDMLSGNQAVIKAQVPLSEVMNYQSQLKSMTGGQGSFVMTLSHYEPAPPNIQQQIASGFQPRQEED